MVETVAEIPPTGFEEQYSCPDKCSDSNTDFVDRRVFDGISSAEYTLNSSPLEQRAFFFSPFLKETNPIMNVTTNTTYRFYTKLE